MRTRKIFIGLWCLAALLAAGSASAEYAVSVYGPRQFLRTADKPNVFQETFPGSPGAATLQISNGGPGGVRRVTAAQVFLNGKLILAPKDFQIQKAFLQLAVPVKASNTLKVVLQSDPGTFLSLQVMQMKAYEEVRAGMVKADPALTSLTLAPERANPGDEVTVRATVLNLARRAIPSATLIFSVEGSEISRAAVGALSPMAQRQFSASFTAGTPGRHQVAARLEPGPEVIDRNTDNNLAFATLRVSGEAEPVPEIEFGEVGISPWPPRAGQPAILRFTLHNPGFADLSDLGVNVYLNGEPLGLAPAAAVMAMADPPARVIEHLGPGMTTHLEFPVADIQGGIVKMTVGNFVMPPLYHIGGIREATWTLYFPEATSIHAYNPDDPMASVNRWFPMGPSHITHNIYDQLPYTEERDPWTGKMTSLAVVPDYGDYDTPTLYAGGRNYGTVTGFVNGSVSGAGLWQRKHGDFAQWRPIGDKLWHMGLSALALDGSYIYAASGDWRAGGSSGMGTGPVFKSTTRGDSWTHYGSPAEGYSRLAVRYTQFLEGCVFAASNRGLLRTKLINSDDPFAGAWENLLPGNIGDLVIHPTNPDIAYAVRYDWISGEFVPLGVYRTDRLTSMAGGQPLEANWQKLNLPIPAVAYGQVHVDLFRTNPQKVYVSILNPGSHLKIHASSDGGDTWGNGPIITNDQIKGKNSFLRAHPTQDRLFYGYETLWTAGWAAWDWSTWSSNPWYQTIVPNIHPDMQDLQFHPRGETFYVACDGGVYFGYVRPDGFAELRGMNSRLQTAEIYDFDVSRADPRVMLAGTQDNGTIRTIQDPYGPSPEWRCTREGDGMYCLIHPGDPQIMYSQYVDGISTTNISYDGGHTWGRYSPHYGLTFNGGWLEQFIAVDPFKKEQLLAQGGRQAQKGIWGGIGFFDWEPAGPPEDSPANRPDTNVRRVLFHPDREGEWFVGTDRRGQIWQRLSSGEWNMIWSHPDADARVTSMSFDPLNSDSLFVSFDNCAAPLRLMHLWKTEDESWDFAWIGLSFPSRHIPGNSEVVIRGIVGAPNQGQGIFVATDKGVYWGRHFLSSLEKEAYEWQPYNRNLPLVDVRKLIPIPSVSIHSMGELRAATHGRGVWGTIAIPMIE